MHYSDKTHKNDVAQGFRPDAVVLNGSGRSYYTDTGGEMA